MENKEELHTKAIRKATEFREKLQNILSRLDEAESQVKLSAEKTEEEIRDHFCHLSKSILSVLDHRCDSLLAQVAELRAQAMTPLTSSRQVVEERLLSSMSILDEDQCHLKGDEKVDCECSLYKKTMSVQRLPKVPDPAHVANISVYFDTNLLQQLKQTIDAHGDVSAFSPVQITQTEERPGSILIVWNEVYENDSDLEMHLFRLQCCTGDVKQEPQLISNYEDVYKGPDMYFLVRDLQAYKIYSFRVSCCNSEDSEWRPWSQPIIAKTTLQPYVWDLSNPCFMITNQGKIATRNSREPSILLCSDQPLYRCSHSLLFHVLDVSPESQSDEGLALFSTLEHSEGVCENFVQPGVIYINMQGAVYVAGKEMTTRLPAIKRGSIVIFGVEPLDASDKLRITIETGDKQICYDWKITSTNSFLNVKFALFVRCEGWKISVE